MERAVGVALLALVASAAAAPVKQIRAGVADRVLMIGIDGLTMDPACLPAGSMPNVEALIAGGSFTRNARTAIQALSGPGWSSFLCAMPPTSTGVTSNSWTPSWEGNDARLTPITGASEHFPCAFDVANAQAPELHIAAYYDWNFLAYLIDSPSLDKEFFCDGYEFGYDECDRLSYVELMNDLGQISTTPDLAFIYFGSLDEDGGHAVGWCSDKYVEVAALIDTYVGDIVDALDRTGLRNTTAIVLSADHGGSYGTRIHGIARDDNLNIPFLVNSPGVKAGYTISQSPIEVVDVTTTAFALLGLQPSNWWIGRYYDEIFV